VACIVHGRACGLGYVLLRDAFIIREGLEVEELITSVSMFYQDNSAGAGEAGDELQDEHLQGHELSDTAACVLNDDIIGLAKYSNEEDRMSTSREGVRWILRRIVRIRGQVIQLEALVRSPEEELVGLREDDVSKRQAP